MFWQNQVAASFSACRTKNPHLTAFFADLPWPALQIDLSTISLLDSQSTSFYAFPSLASFRDSENQPRSDAKKK